MEEEGNSNDLSINIELLAGLGLELRGPEYH